MTEERRLDLATDEVLEYLDGLREDGFTDRDLLGTAPSLLHERFELTPKQAREALGYWMRTFSEVRGD